MPNTTLNVRIKMRSKPAAEWTESDILLAGELGFDTTNKLFKLGDGVTAWPSLQAFYDPSEIQGNVNADELFFTKDLVFTEPFGKYTPGSSGSVEIPTLTNDMSIQDLLESAFAEEANPTISQPSCSITLSNSGAKEVGTSFTPSYNVSFNAGKYQYGPATGITVSSYAVTDTNSNNASTQSDSFDAFTIGDDTNYKCSVTVQHTQGAVPLTNLGNEYAAGQIAAGSKSANSASVTGFRAIFYGGQVSPISLDSAGIRSLTNGGAYKSTFSISIPNGCTQVVIALPNGHTVTSVADQNAFGTDIFSAFVASTAQVEGLNSYTSAEYNVYTYTPAAALSANTYNITCA